MKKCNGCGEVKDISSFESYKCIKGEEYRRKMCKKCRMGQRRKRRGIKERKIVSEKDLIIKEVVGKYMELKSIERVGKFFGVSHKRISEILKENNIQLYIANRKDPEHIRKRLVDKVVKYRKKREGHDFFFRFKNKLRTNIYLCFSKKGFDKNDISYIEILGCNWESVRLHFESLFKEDMSWENYGKWEVDHIIPNDSAITKEDVIRLSHISNLQPLWMMDNKIKYNKIL
jgi:hypothetical protein